MKWNRWAQSPVVAISLLVLLLLILFARSFDPRLTLSIGDGSVRVIASHYRYLPHAYTAKWMLHQAFGMNTLPNGIAPGFLFAYVMPVWKYADANYIFHLLLMGIFGYLLIRDITGNRLASLIGGAWMMLQPHVLSHILPGHIGHLAMAGWIPGAFFFLRRAVLHGRIFSWVMAGTFVGAGIAVGTHDVMLFFSLLLGAYGLFLLLRSHPYVTGPLSPPQRPPLGRTLTGITVAGLLTLAIGYQAIFVNLAMQVRTRSYVAQSVEDRGEGKVSAQESWFWATQWSIPVEEVLDCAIPGFFGWGSSNPQNPYRGRVGQTEGFPQHRQGLPNLNDVSIYLGAVILLGCLLAIVLDRRNGEMWFFLIAGFVACGLSFGKHAPFYHWFYAIPHMDAMRNPIKWFYLTSFSLGIVASIGIRALDRPLTDSINARGLRRRLAWILGTATLVIAAGAAVFLGTRSGNAAALFWQNPVLVSKSAQAIGIGLLFWTMASASFLLMLPMPGMEEPRACGSRSWLPSLGKVLLALTFVAEIIYVDTQYLPYQRVADVVPRTSFVDLLRAETTPFRVHVLQPNPALNRVTDICDYAGFLETLIPTGPADDTVLFLHALNQLPERLLRLGNIRFVLASEEIRAPFLRVVQRLSVGNTPVIFHRLVNDLPRYYLVPNWRVVEQPEQRFSSLAASEFDPSREVLINELAAEVPAPPPIPASSMRCEIRSYAPQRIELATESDGECMLVGLDRYDPAWHVYIDNSEARLMRANAILRACWVPAGKHTVTLVFEGGSALPVAITLLGWALAGVAALGTGLHHLSSLRRPQPVEPPQPHAPRHEGNTK